ncbi:MAG TPA: hypothetical protein VMH79_12750 [Thermoanaerobaculia bacterium]|nr:hypothetical protein [Thermoanaerobaculia bacterium]
MRKTLVAGLTALAALVLASGCTNKQGTTESPVFVTVNIDAQPGIINIANVAPVQISTMTLASHAKDPTSVDTQGFSDVQVNQYTVVYRRTDGGTTVPPMQTFACGVLLPHEGTVTLTDFPVMYATAVQQSPFDQLLPFNGGIDRQTGRPEIDTAFDITFYGQTVSGKRVQSETASGILIFEYVASAPARAAR